MKTQALPINWFDMFLLLVIAIGLLRGRRRGMSEEFLDMLKWIVFLIGIAFLRKPLSDFIRTYAHLQPLVANVLGYLGVLLAAHGLFVVLKRLVGEKLVGSDLFGRTEYYLGMLAGVFRCLCVLLVFITLINARLITDAEYQKHLKESEELYGSDFFLSWGSVQRSIFRESFVGPHIGTHLRAFLIEPMPYVDILEKRESMGKRKEREIQELMTGSKKRP